MSKKKLNENLVVNELKGSSFFPSKPKEQAEPTPAQPVQPLVNQPINRSINQPVNQIVNHFFDQSPVLGKPKGFYITEKQDRDLDRAVELLEKKCAGKVNQKIDRSVILRLILESNDLSKNESIDKLFGLLKNKLISQLTD